MNGLSALDLAILLVLAWFAIAGIRRGFVLSIFDVLSLIVTLVLATRTFHLAGAMITTQFGVSPLVADLLGFTAIMVIGETVRIIGAALVSAALRPLFFAIPPLGYLNSLAGLVPGALRGLGYVAVALILVESLPFTSGLHSDINRSPVASTVLELVGKAGPSVQDALSVMIDGNTTGGLDPSSGLASYVAIPSGVESSPDPAAESQVFEMTNLARTQAGLPPLILDRNLSTVARLHSIEMFQLAYFSHDSPVGGSPTERLQRADISFSLSGENIAYAPTVSMAFNGLMNSPEHRDNILSTEFHRVGIGVAEAGIWGYMITEDFTN